METIETTKLDEMKGAFVESLKRNNKKIREDRAISIAEDTQMMYGRKIQDIEQAIKRLKRERENMLDLSPSTADSLILAIDYKAENFVDNDLKIGVELHNLEKKLEIGKTQFKKLFGSEYISTFSI